MNSNTTQIREQLIAAMQLAEVPLSTDDLANAAPPITFLTPCRTWYHDNLRPEHPSVLVNECQGDDHLITRRRFGPEVYHHLRALERAGLCRRLKFDGQRRVLWQYTGQPPEALTLLEELWEASA